MRLNIFGKTIILDESNLGINYCINRCFEIPTESWILTEYVKKSGGTREEARDFLFKTDEENIRKIIKRGMINILKVTEDTCGLDLSKEIEACKNG